MRRVNKRINHQAADSRSCLDEAGEERKYRLLTSISHRITCQWAGCFRILALSSKAALLNTLSSLWHLNSQTVYLNSQIK